MTFRCMFVFILMTNPQLPTVVNSLPTHPCRKLGLVYVRSLYVQISFFKTNNLMVVCVIFIQMKWAFLKYWNSGYFCDIIFIIFVSWQTSMVVKGFFVFFFFFKNMVMEVKTHKIIYALSFNLLSYLCFSVVHEFKQDIE